MLFLRILALTKIDMLIPILYSIDLRALLGIPLSHILLAAIESCK